MENRSLRSFWFCGAIKPTNSEETWFMPRSFKAGVVEKMRSSCLAPELITGQAVPATRRLLGY